MNIVIPLSTKQIQFMRSVKKGIVYRGGIRSGKTFIAAYKAILNALKGRRQLMISFSYKALRDAVLFTIKKCLSNMCLKPRVDYDINKSEMIVTVRGTEILLRSGDNPDSIRGLSVHDVFIDESREFPDNEVFLIAIGRMSESNDGQWHITSSPKGKDWTHALYADDGGSNVELIIQRTGENPFLPDNYEDELRRNYTSKFAAQELEADIISMSAGVFDPGWFIMDDTYIDVNENRAVRYWDTAVTIKDKSDYSAGALCTMHHGSLHILNIIKDKFTYPDLKKKIIEQAHIDGPKVIIGIEVTGQSTAFAQDLQVDPALRGYIIKPNTPKGDKLNRCLPWASRAESGLVRLHPGGWVANFKDECSDFSADMSHLHDDQVDSVSGAYSLLNKTVTTVTHRKLY